MISNEFSARGPSGTASDTHLVSRSRRDRWTRTDLGDHRPWTCGEGLVVQVGLPPRPRELCRHHQKDHRLRPRQAKLVGVLPERSTPRPHRSRSCWRLPSPVLATSKTSNHVDLVESYTTHRRIPRRERPSRTREAPSGTTPSRLIHDFFTALDASESKVRRPSQVIL